MNWLWQLYAPFFKLSNWQHVITSGSDWAVILSLVLMECLLSVDNAIVLAAQTQILPDHTQQRKSLVYGLWGAYLFRFIVIGIGVYLIHLWEIKVLGALYLFYLSFQYFWAHGQSSGTRKPHQSRLTDPKRHHRISLFWRVVISIEAMDIVFSLDSVLASLAISNNPVVVLIGGMIGILCMRGVAEVIIKLMQKIPELETMAYILIAFIAFKLLVSVPPLNWKMPDALFAGIVVGAVLITIAIHLIRTHKKA
ncbi:integral membrane TerC family protein [Lactobacillus selangorensis]|uniref:Integral membrane TerC family protein n=1 Tax=Lactobacillus selangorensis TaxID=81857 RepID=A0A0R2FQE0_9LACO|nr:TerC family protein [Lactobacillus selangorensis]KRN27897.1 integral membrane TerC family protein [Lactobacillus selangorensis]KRN30632.1 integral membrane TerC family protein [Lactobacillus selangorensis]